MGEEYLSRENQVRSEALSSRVSLLKSLAIDIEGETKDQNALLDDTDKEMSGVSSLLSHGKKRATQILMAGKRDRKTMLYVAIGVALFLFSTYSLLIRLSSASFSPNPPTHSVPS